MDIDFVSEASRGKTDGGINRRDSGDRKLAMGHDIRPAPDQIPSCLAVEPIIRLGSKRA